MIYSVLSDRLGNILFEIAAGISLARRLNVPFKAFVGQEPGWIRLRINGLSVLNHGLKYFIGLMI